jgi:hypothetical protein
MVVFACRGTLRQLGKRGLGSQGLVDLSTDQVEQAGLVTQEEKDAFAKAMAVMNSHQMKTMIAGVFRKDGGNGSDAQQEQVAENRFAQVGLLIVHVRSDSLDWILQRGALLIPNDKTRQTMRNLTRYKPVWGPVMKPRDLEKGLDGNWQIVDAHYVYPWTGK